MSDAVAPAPVPARQAFPWWRAPAVVLFASSLLVSFIGYGRTLGGHFQGDDFGYVGRYFDFPFAQWPRLFVHGWADDLWSISLRELRPVNALAFMVDARLWGLDPVGFRLTNLLLHATCATLVGLIAWHAAERRLRAGIVAAILFALHPVHAGTVAWITGRVDVLSTLFTLATFFAFLRYRHDRKPRWLIMLGLGHTAAIFTKESGATLPLLLGIADLIWLREQHRPRGREAWTPYVVCAVVLVAYFFSRRAAFGTGGPEGVGRGLPDWSSGASYFEFVRREIAYFAHLLPPLQRWLVEWRDAGFPLAPAPLLKGLVVAAALVASGLLLRLWSTQTSSRMTRHAVMFFAVGWFVVATVPLMVTYFSARHLYPAAAGFSIALGLVLHGTLRSPQLFSAITAAVVLLFGLQLQQTLRPWREGGAVSQAIAREVAEVERSGARGGALLLDVPDLVGGSFCWSWATPHGLRPPFTREPLGDRFVVLGNPPTFAFTARWRHQSQIRALASVESQSWLIQASETGPVRRLMLAPEKLRPAAQRLAIAVNRTPPEIAWRNFIAELGSR